MTEKPTGKQSNEIGDILDSMVLWERGEGFKRFEEYKAQRFWEKKVAAKLVPIDNEFSEIVPLVGDFLKSVSG